MIMLLIPGYPCHDFGMPGLTDLPDADRKRLTTAFAAARELKSGRAAFARSAEVEVSSVQTLEGKRSGPLSESMINRLTVAVGWPPEHWRAVANGSAAPVVDESVSTSTDGVGSEVRYRKPEGMSDEQWRLIRAKTDGYLQALLDDAATER